VGVISIIIAARSGSLMTPAIVNLKTQESVSSRTLEERIKRVEAGLLPSVFIQGLPRVSRTLNEAMKVDGITGVSVAVVNSYELEWARGYGLAEAKGTQPITPETLFQAGSISKTLTTVAALYFVEKGKLSLDEDVNGKLVSWKVPTNDFTREQSVTLRRLLSHSAGMTVHGFDGYRPGEPLPTLVQILNGERPAKNEPVRVNYVPGSRFRYSGGGMLVVQRLLEEITSKPFPQIIKEVIFDKVGMKHSYFLQPLTEELGRSAATGHERDILPGKWTTKPELGAAGLWTTPSDLARFMIELQKAKLGRSNQILSTAMVTQMFTPQNELFGLGVHLKDGDTPTWFVHGGITEGFRAEMVGSIEGGKGAVVMINSPRQPILYEITRSTAKEYSWPNFLPKERTVATLDPAVYQAYVGKYLDPEGPPGATLNVTFAGGKLRFNNQEALPEFPSNFFLVSNNADLTFLKDGQGKVKELRLKFNHVPGIIIARKIQP